MRGSAVEAAKLDREVAEINARRTRWRVFASSPAGRLTRGLYATRLGKVNQEVAKHELFAMTVAADDLAALEALMDAQDEIVGW
jgi:hypothetical protein